MGCGCAGGVRAAPGAVKYEVETANSGGRRVSRYPTEQEAKAAASSGGTAYRVDGQGRRTRL